MKIRGCLKLLTAMFLIALLFAILVWTKSCSRWVSTIQLQNEESRKQAVLQQEAIGKIKRAEYFYNQELYSQALTEYKQLINSGAGLNHYDQILALLTTAISTGDYEFGSQVGRNCLIGSERYEMRDYIYIHTALCCIGEGDRAAAKDITQRGTTLMDPENWTYTLNSYLNGEISRDKMLSMADTYRTRLTDAHLLIGFEAWASGNVSLAKDSLGWVARNGESRQRYRIYDNIGMARGLLNRLTPATSDASLILGKFVSDGGPYKGFVSGYFRGSDFVLSFTSYDRVDHKFGGEIHWVKDDKRFQFTGNVLPDEIQLVQSEPGRTGFGPMGSPDLTTFLLKLDQNSRTLSGTLSDDGLYLSSPSPVTIQLEKLQ